jgi:nitrite reductase/ring-hydroxylating ferredoxin subunit
VLVDVGALEDFADGTPRVVTVHGRELGVVVWKGQAFALANRCPHMGAPLCEGIVVSKLVSGDGFGAMQVDGDCPVMVCPWHRWGFEFSTGTATFERPDGKRGRAPMMRAKSYAAQIAEGRVLVEFAATSKRRRAEAGQETPVQVGDPEPG